MEGNSQPKVEIIKPNYDEEANKESTSGNKAAIILAYLVGWVGGLIVFLLEKQNKFIKWHALQGLILGVIEALCIIIFSILVFIPYVGWFFLKFGYFLAGVAWMLGIVAIVMGCNGKTFRIPGVSKLTDKWFKMK